MIEIKRLPEFDVWFSKLKDVTTKARLIARLKKVSLGNLGDVKPVGEGVMLGGGEKSTQARDIAKAIALSKTLED